MDLVKEAELNRRVSWGFIIAGVVTVMAVSLLLTTLGSGLGFQCFHPSLPMSLTVLTRLF
ncbi:hypothetical protein ABIE06_004559 [Pantoea dispersa]|uniref:hypothetical protein n=1 Tax=Pantoea dispersa TaxID=59814 RepID=UPI003D25DF55